MVHGGLYTQPQLIIQYDISLQGHLGRDQKEGACTLFVRDAQHNMHNTAADVVAEAVFETLLVLLHCILLKYSHAISKHVACS